MASSVHPPPPPPGVGSVVVVVVIVDTELVGLVVVVVVVVVVVRPPRTDAARHAPPPVIEVPASRTSHTSVSASLACFANRPSPTPAHSTYVDVDRPRFHPAIVVVFRPSVRRRPARSDAAALSNLSTSQMMKSNDENISSNAPHGASTKRKNINQSIHRSIHRSIHPSIDRSIHRSIHRSIDR